MNFIKIKHKILSSGFDFNHWAMKQISLSRIYLIQNYYETLGLSESCSHEEIKTAFFEKSKQLHPDKNSQNPKNHRLCVSVNEAYSILIKRETRKAYDAQLAFERKARHFNTLETDAPNEKFVFHDDSLWENRDKEKHNDYRNKGYYGIKGIKKLPNHYIAGGVVLLAVIGVFIHVIVAKIIYQQALRNLEERNLNASQQYMLVREKAHKHGKVAQLNQFKQHKEKTGNTNKTE